MIKLTATQLPRFMACNGSINLRNLPEFDRDDSQRQEGNAAHWLIEQVYGGQITAEELVDRKSPHGVYITPEMVEHTQEFLSETGGHIEHDTSFDGMGYHISGRADRVIFDNGILEVHDFKYGWRLVEVEENWTLIAHAIGFALQLVHRNGIDINRDVKGVVFKIFQPRPYHPEGKVREWSVSAYELVEYHKKLNEVMSKPSEYVNTGSQCTNCPSVAVCSGHNKATMNAIEVSEIPFDFDIDDKDIPEMLNNLNKAKKTIETTLKAYEDVAMHRLKEGRVVSGYALERSLTNRQWLETVTPEFLHMMTGRDDMMETKIISPSQAVKKGLDEEVVNSLSERKETGLKLCKVDPTKKVEKMFGDYFKTMKGN